MTTIRSTRIKTRQQEFLKLLKQHGPMSPAKLMSKKILRLNYKRVHWTMDKMFEDGLVDRRFERGQSRQGAWVYFLGSVDK